MGSLPRLLRPGRKGSDACKRKAVEVKDRVTMARAREQAAWGEEKNILYVWRQLYFITQHQTRRHGMGTRFIPRYTVHLPTPDSLFLSLFHPISFARFFPAHSSRWLLLVSALTGKSFLRQRNYYATTKLATLRWSHTCVRERDVDVISNDGRNCTGNTHEDRAMNAKR